MSQKSQASCLQKHLAEETSTVLESFSHVFLRRKTPLLVKAEQIWRTPLLQEKSETREKEIESNDKNKRRRQLQVVETTANVSYSCPFFNHSYSCRQIGTADDFGSYQS